MCIANIVSDDKTMSGDELEALDARSWKITTVANANQTLPFTTASDSGNVEDFSAGGIT